MKHPVAHPDDALRFAALLGALRFAADRRRGQRRTDAAASPCLDHPIAVAELLAAVGGVGDLAVLQAAALHDTLEDTETPFGELAARFGAGVARIVAEVTDAERLDEAGRRALPIEHAPLRSREAKLVKIADEIAHVRDVVQCPPEDWDRARRAQSLARSAQVVARCRGVSAALEEAFAVMLAEARARLAE